MNITPGSFEGLSKPEVELFRAVLAPVSGLGIEIGCCDGYSSAVILEASALCLTSIDPFIPMTPQVVGQERLYRLNVALYGARASLIVGYSHDVAATWNKPLDFLFIDGCHGEEASQQDFDDWTPFLKFGGILAMHDSRNSRSGAYPTFPGPSKVADEQIFAQPQNWKLLGEVGSLTVAALLLQK